MRDRCLGAHLRPEHAGVQVEPAALGQDIPRAQAGKAQYRTPMALVDDGRQILELRAQALDTALPHRGRARRPSRRPGPATAPCRRAIRRRARASGRAPDAPRPPAPGRAARGPARATCRGARRWSARHHPAARRRGGRPRARPRAASAAAAQPRTRAPSGSTNTGCTTSTATVSSRSGSTVYSRCPMPLSAAADQRERDPVAERRAVGDRGDVAEAGRTGGAVRIFHQMCAAAQAPAAIERLETDQRRPLRIGQPRTFHELLADVRPFWC